MATEHAVAGRALGRRKWHVASLPPLSAPRDFSAAQLLAPAAAAGALELLEEPESDEPLDEDELLDDDELLDEDELLLDDEPPELPSFLVEL
jgi:hypothetical protein